MSKETALKEIMRCVYAHETDKNMIESYILGELEEEPDLTGNIKIYNYYLPAFYEDESENEMLYRLIRLYSKKNPDLMIRDLCRKTGRYSLYKRAGVEQDIVKKDFLYNTEKCIDYYVFNTKWQITETCHMMDEFTENYTDLANSIIKSHCFSKDTKQIGAILLLSRKIEQKQTNTEEKKQCEKLPFYKIFQKAVKNEQDTSELERVFYSILKETFPEPKIQRVMREYAKERDCIDYYENLKPISLGFPKKYNQNILFFICYTCMDCSALLKEGIRIASMLFSSEFLVAKFNNNEKEVKEYMNTLEFPVEMIVRYIAFALTGYHSSTEKNYYINSMKKLMEQNINEFKRIMNLMADEKEILFSLLYSMLNNKNALLEKDAKQLVEKAENIIIEYFKKTQEESQTFIFEEPELAQFEFLKEENSSGISKTSGNFYPYRGIGRSVIFSCVYILDDSIVARNVINMMIKCLSPYNLKSGIDLFRNYKIVKDRTYEEIFDRLYDTIHLSLENICLLYIREKDNQLYQEEDTFISFLLKHKTEAEEGIGQFCYDSETMNDYLKILYKNNESPFDWNALCKAFQRKSKPVANYAEKLLIPHEKQTRASVEELLKAKSKITTDTAMRLIRIWDNDKIELELRAIHTVDELVFYVEKLYTKNNEKNTPFLKEMSYDCVRQLNSEQLIPSVLTKYYISEYMLLKELYVIKICDRIREFMNPYDFRKLILDIYELWISEGASVKYKNILLPFALTATESQIMELKKQIDDWAEHGKPALAAFAVQSLCMNASKMALLLADTMSKKHKNKKVRTAALLAMDVVAQELGISREELDDMIVPCMGFDKNRVHYYEYGQRKFKAVLGENLDIILYDEAEKQIKSLPKASAKYNDNEQLATAAKEDLKSVKKQLKTILDIQKARIFKAVLTGRKWTFEKWRELFIENPIMTCFATNLIWEERDEKDTLIKTFRYMEDGSFNTVEEEEHELQKGSFIAPLHPVDISEEELLQWKQQLEDYEIIQPVEQISIPVLQIEEAEAEKFELTQFRGKKIYGATFKSVANKLGFTLVFDSYGELSGCMYDDSDTVLKINTSSFYMGDYNAVTELGSVLFTKGETPIPIGQAPKRLLSLGMYIGSVLTAKTVEAE